MQMIDIDALSVEGERPELRLTFFSCSSTMRCCRRRSRSRLRWAMRTLSACILDSAEVPFLFSSFSTHKRQKGSFAWQEYPLGSIMADDIDSSHDPIRVAVPGKGGFRVFSRAWPCGFGVALTGMLT